MPAGAPPWRRRLSELGRGAGAPHAPLFAPLLYGVASQIEALPPAEVTADPTRLAKCLGELRRALGVAHLTTAAPSAMEAEALGAGVDRETWPPAVRAPASADVLALAGFGDVWTRSEALAASLEATRRLAATEPRERPIVAALTGPDELARQLLGGAVEDGAAGLELAGRALAALVRSYAEAGAAAVVLCERSVPAGADAWEAAVRTIANVARFHRIPALLAFATGEPQRWPAGPVPCPAGDAEGPGQGPLGMAAPADPEAWAALAGRTGRARIVVTAEDVDAALPVDRLQAACEVALAVEREPAA